MLINDLFENSIDPEQQKMDLIRAGRLSREREPAGSDAIDARLAANNNARQQYAETGRFWLKQKDTQQHLNDQPYTGKAAANAAALELLKQQPELRGNLVITAYGPGETQGVAEGYQLDEGAIETITALVKKIPGIGKYYQMAQQYKPQLIEILKTSKSGKEVKQKMEQLAAGQSATVAESGMMKQLGGLAVGGGSILSTMWMNAMGMIDGVLAHAAAGEVGGAVASGSILGLIPVTLMLFAAMLMFKGSNQSSDEKAQAFQAQRREQGVAEGPNDGKEDNFTIDDIKNLERIRDFETLKAQAKELIKGKPARRMKPEKISWFYNHIDTLKNPLAVIKMMYDLMLAGEGNKVIGSRNSMSSNSYRSKFGEQDVAEGSEQMVGFHLDSERAYQAVMSRFGDMIDQDQDSGTMYAPERLWPKIEQVAYDADGIGAQRDDDLENPEHYGVAEGDTQLQPGMQVKDGTIVKVNGNTVTVKTSNGDLMNMNIHDVDVAQNMAEGNKKSGPPEADYGADYQDMVARVKKLAGLGPLKTVWDPQKRVYKNVPTAVQPGTKK